MRVCIRIDDIPEDIRAAVIKQGRVRGPRLEIEVSTLAALSQKHTFAAFAPSREMFPGISLRSEIEQAALLTICETCDRNKAGRCSLCKSCGGGIPVTDWVKLSHHRCPERKWGLHEKAFTRITPIPTY